MDIFTLDLEASCPWSIYQIMCKTHGTGEISKAERTKSCYKIVPKWSTVYPNKWKKNLIDECPPELALTFNAKAGYIM